MKSFFFLTLYFLIYDNIITYKFKGHFAFNKKNNKLYDANSQCAQFFFKNYKIIRDIIIKFKTKVAKINILRWKIWSFFPFFYEENPINLINKIKLIKKLINYCRKISD